MKKFLIYLIPIVVIGIVLIAVFLIPPTEDENSEVSLGYGSVISESVSAYATSSVGKTIYDGAVFLERIIVGLDETNAGITLVDADTSVGLPAAFFDIEGSTLQGVYEIGARLYTGIFYTASTASNTTFIYIPMGK